ncbi:hypothetical protein ThidrDRAFT_1099 [Thiorhodococcus drewsii AZ1]|uniref:Uncharacterized protein n=1 Tax=Thiorhodococcus drewsii AZ1 TaxID=765913 RepID=G2DYI7_9GAMM|nr:hypothetical protein [Thiorhodococcus drewsii]EGV32614.1 hypothetical protein ThidrDRAFT_1099 [Thiorhodococcus drewsii AZ1]
MSDWEAQVEHVCAQSWKALMAERRFFPFYPLKGIGAALPRTAESPTFDQLRQRLGANAALEAWSRYPDVQAIDQLFTEASGDTASPISLYEAALMIGRRLLDTPSALNGRAAEFFATQIRRKAIDPRHPRTLIRYSDHPPESEIPDLTWRLFPQELQDFAIAQWGRTLYRASELGGLRGTPEQREKPLDPRERKTLLRLIAALCDLAQLDLEQPYKSAEVIRVKLETLGITLKTDTIAEKLKALPEVIPPPPTPTTNAPSTPL